MLEIGGGYCSELAQVDVSLPELAQSGAIVVPVHYNKFNGLGEYRVWHASCSLIREPIVALFSSGERVQS